MLIFEKMQLFCCLGIPVLCQLPVQIVYESKAQQEFVNGLFPRELNISLDHSLHHILRREEDLLRHPW
jgi:hypothetical protein